jgi:hypothetical protein
MTVDKTMVEALASYTGTVMRCPPGRASAPDVKERGQAQFQCVCGHAGTMPYPTLFKRAVAGATTRTKAVTVAVPAMWPGAAMSRGLGVWQRRLLAALEERPTVSLVDVLPRPYARSQYVALHRAAWSLRGKGKVDIHHAQRKGHMWVCRLQSD